MVSFGAPVADAPSLRDGSHTTSTSCGATRCQAPHDANVAQCSFATRRNDGFISGATGHDIVSRGLGGGRGAYRQVDGDLPKAARTDVPAQAVAHRRYSGGSDGGGGRQVCVYLYHAFEHTRVEKQLAELCSVIRLRDTPPDIVCVNETF